LQNRVEEGQGYCFGSGTFSLREKRSSTMIFSAQLLEKNQVLTFFKGTEQKQ